MRILLTILLLIMSINIFSQERFDTNVGIFTGTSIPYSNEDNQINTWEIEYQAEYYLSEPSLKWVGFDTGFTYISYNNNEGDLLYRLRMNFRIHAFNDWLKLKIIPPILNLNIDNLKLNGYNTPPAIDLTIFNTKSFRINSTVYFYTDTFVPRIGIYYSY